MDGHKITFKLPLYPNNVFLRSLFLSQIQTTIAWHLASLTLFIKN